MGGTMPEDYPTPEKSLKQLEKQRKHLLIENKRKMIKQVTYCFKA